MATVVIDVATDAVDAVVTIHAADATVITMIDAIVTVIVIIFAVADAVAADKALCQSRGFFLGFTYAFKLINSSICGLRGCFFMHCLPTIS